MTEEEKKAIKNMKKFARYKDSMSAVSASEMNIILNLVEKLQKENRKLKQEQAKRSWIHVKENGEVEPLLYISKDKIRKKIEELENGEQCYYEFSTVDLVDLLKILLEEE